VNRVLLNSTAFVKAARKYIRRHPQSAAEIQTTLELLASDAFDPRLKTHKLKGDLQGSWACSGGYDLRIVFEIVTFQGSEAILLESVGTHEEAY
jgi:mRNA-degrading endonuclease YafQ of YafQ-DinJ toxin-antitoxin module